MNRAQKSDIFPAYAITRMHETVMDHAITSRAADEYDVMTDEGEIDWAVFRDLVEGERDIATQFSAVKEGFAYVEKIQREGNNLYFCMMPTDEFDVAMRYAKIGIDWNRAKKQPSIETAIADWTREISRPMVSKSTVLKIEGYLAAWALYYPETLWDDLRVDIMMLKMSNVRVTGPDGKMMTDRNYYHRVPL